MSPGSHDDGSPSERLRSLELKAQAVRHRLTRAVDRLDERRHHAIALGSYARAAARPALLVALGAAVVIGAGVLVVRSVARTRRRRRLSEIVARAIRRLDLVPRPSLAKRMFEKAAMSLVTMAASELVGVAAKRIAREEEAARPRMG
jgi:hypothetical protein